MKQIFQSLFFSPVITANKSVGDIQLFLMSNQPPSLIPLIDLGNPRLCIVLIF
jgi:hypothetical protein